MENGGIAGPAKASNDWEKGQLVGAEDVGS